MAVERNVRRSATAAGWLVGEVDRIELQRPRSRRVPICPQRPIAQSSRLLGPQHAAQTGGRSVTAPQYAGTPDWGTTDELTPLETLMWRADVDRAMRSSMMAVEVLDTQPDWMRLVDAHEWASRVVPRLRDRVSE